MSGRIERAVQERNFFHVQPIVKSILYVAAAAVAFRIAHNIFNWWLLDQINKIDCFQSPKALTSYGSDKYIEPQKLYCYGMTLKKEGFSKNPYEPSSSKEVIESLKKAADLGLTLGKIELCKPSTFYGVDTKEIKKVDIDNLKQLCCPDQTPGLCPWEPILQKLYVSSGYTLDHSTEDQKAFGWLSAE